MPTATIKFNLPEDREEYDRANKALDLCMFIWDFQGYLRGQWKYGLGDDISAIYDKWHELKELHGIDLDTLIS